MLLGSVPYLFAPSLPGKRNIKPNMIRNGGNTIPGTKRHAVLFISCRRRANMLKLDTTANTNIINFIISTGEAEPISDMVIITLDVFIMTKIFITVNMYNKAFDVLVLKSNAFLNNVLK